MRINDPRFPVKTESAYDKDLNVALYRTIREIQTQLNALSEDKAIAHYGAMTSVPTTGTWSIGDEVKNSAPAEAGTAGSKYVITGWICTVSGTPGTWLQQRTLTGN
jgi:hypothetical protein